jgi:hypothetical protein
MKSKLKCPKCGSVIYSRRVPVCGRCGAKLPPAVMFDAQTRNRVERIIEQDKKRLEWERKFPGHHTSS